VTDLKPVLALVRLANTDNDVMTIEAEAALMGFAFEQYFDAKSAQGVADRFGARFRPYGKTTTDAAQATRPGIRQTPIPASMRPSQAASSPSSGCSSFISAAAPSLTPADLCPAARGDGRRSSIW